MSTYTWDGCTDPSQYHPEANAFRQRLADAAKAYDWPTVQSLLALEPELINTTRPGGQSYYTVLHQAAHGGAPTAVVQHLLSLGAWRTLRTAKGERAVDIARRRNHSELATLLEPVIRHQVDQQSLQTLQRLFHELIQERMSEFRITQQLRLPELEPLLELENEDVWFPIPGMYGGFGYRLSELVGNTVLTCESGSRVVGGSVQYHVISPYGRLLIALEEHGITFIT